MAYTTIDNPAEYFNTILYTGTGSARTITGVGFQPDWVWVKDRTSTNYHYLYDVLRGNNLNLFTNDTSAEVNVTTGQNGGGVGSQASDGFTIVAGVVNTNNVNTNANLYASWNWLANGAGVSNTAGSITSTVSANTTAGFSIVSYAGNSTNDATIGHGLGVAPSMVIIKNRTSALSGSAGAHWITRHKGISMTTFSSACQVALSLTNGSITNSHGTLITNGQTLLQIKSGSSSPNYFHVGETGNNYIAYCFAEVKGFSKFGSYTGNGSSDGTFVYTGFKPAFLVVKRYSDDGYDWLMYDNKRQVEFNVVDDFLKPNLSDAETTGNANQSLDFLSNGIKFRGSGASSNGSGSSYIYMAFAENPFVSSTGIPTTAR